MIQSACGLRPMRTNGPPMVVDCFEDAAPRCCRPAKMHDVDPHARLSKTLQRIAQGWPISQMEALMPWNFKSLNGFSLESTLQRRTYHINRTRSHRHDRASRNKKPVGRAG